MAVSGWSLSVSVGVLVMCDVVLLVLYAVIFGGRVLRADSIAILRERRKNERKTNIQSECFC